MSGQVDLFNKQVVFGLRIPNTFTKQVEFGRHDTNPTCEHELLPLGRTHNFDFFLFFISLYKIEIPLQINLSVYVREAFSQRFEPRPCLPLLTTTYTCGVIITLKVCGGDLFLIYSHCCCAILSFFYFICVCK